MSDLLVGATFFVLIAFIVWLAWRRKKSIEYVYAVDPAEPEILLQAHIEDGVLIIDRVIEPPE